MSYRRRSDVRNGCTCHDDRPVPQNGIGRWRRAPYDAPMQDVTGASPRIWCPLRGRCRPPRGWAGSSLDLPPGALYPARAGDLDSFQRTWNRLQMAAGQMQVECSIADLGMAK